MTSMFFVANIIIMKNFMLKTQDYITNNKAVTTVFDGKLLNC